MESVGSSKEEVKWNTPVPAPHIIPYSYFPSHFLAQISNTSAKIILVSENDGIESNKNGEQVSNLGDYIILTQNCLMGYDNFGLDLTLARTTHTQRMCQCQIQSHSTILFRTWF